MLDFILGFLLILVSLIGGAMLIILLTPFLVPCLFLMGILALLFTIIDLIKHVIKRLL